MALGLALCHSGYSRENLNEYHGATASILPPFCSRCGSNVSSHFLIREAPMPYSDLQLETLLDDLESDRVERKQSFSNDIRNTVREAVCALANDLPNHRLDGLIFIGARDDGTAAQLPITDELILALASIKSDGNIVPPPSLFVEKRLLRGSAMAVLTVLPSDSPPVRYNGRICVRFGPRRGYASAQDERLLNEKRRFGDRPFDARPVRGATLADLDTRLFESIYLPAAFARDILEANERSIEQRLAATKMIASLDEQIPTVLGLLTLGSRARDYLPGAYIQFVRFAGADLADPISDEKLVDGTLHDCLRRIDEILVSHNRTRVDFKSESTEIRRPLYPLVALQQLIRNAVLHRTYEASNAPIRVQWFDDRIEILSPGGPFGAVTSENFGQPGITDYRNPNVAEAMRVLGFIQRFGAGIPSARSALAGNGNPPLRFDVQPAWVNTTLWPAI